MVDIPRKSQSRLRWIRRILYSVIALSAISGTGWYISQLESAAPTVDLDQVWTDMVKRGPMLRQVRGLGRLVPEEIRWVTAATTGCVEIILLQPGARVAPDTVLLELSNSQLQQNTVSAEWDWKAAQTSLEDLKVTLENQRLTQEAGIAMAESEYTQAVLRYEADSELAKDGLVSSLELRLKKETLEQLNNRLQIEKKRFESSRKSIEAQLAVKLTRIDQLHAAYDLKKRQLDQLKVRAGVGGVLHIVSVEVGQQVSPGTNLARVANPDRLKAELKVAETQAKDIQVGQEVSIDTRNSIIPGKVSRIDPAVIDGTVTVDVKLEAELPKGARPDLSVDGTIVLDRLEDVLYVGRPVQGQEDSRIRLFKLDPDRTKAERVTVSLGTSSVNTIEVKEGLNQGDEVILSDMTAQEGYDSIRLK
jgi:HlyD family secretion protein